MKEHRQMQIDDEITIDLKDIYYLLLHKWKQVLMFFIIGGVLFGLITFFLISPKYEATAKLYVVSSSYNSFSSLTDIQVASSLTADYESLILSRSILEATVQNLGLEIEDINDLKKAITISTPRNTRIINITTRTKNPELSRDISNELARLTITWLPDIMGSSVPNIVEQAVAPQKKIAPSNIKNAVMGGIIFAIVYVGIVVTKYIMDDTIRTPDELEKYFGILPLAVIPESGFLERPVSPKRILLPNSNNNKNTSAKKSNILG